MGAFEWGSTFPIVNSDLSIDLPCVIYLENSYGFTLLPHTFAGSGPDLYWRLDLSSLTSTAPDATCPQFGPDLSLNVETAFFNGFSYGFKLLFTSLDEPGLHWVLDPGSLVAK
jgi:hypothetical protein